MSEDVFKDEKAVLFFSLVHMFQRSAMVSMGFLNGHDGKMHWNMKEARDAIDMLTMLREKTSGNLDEHEDRLLNGVISELQLHFVKAPEVKRLAEEEEAKAVQVEQTFKDPTNSPVEELGSEEE